MCRAQKFTGGEGDGVGVKGKENCKFQNCAG